MDTFDKLFSRFMWATDIIFLVASMPHIAAWFAHFDNPTDFWSGLYAWSVGFGLAFAIDGVSFMLLLAITRMIRQGKTKNGGTMFGLFAFMAIIAVLSWFINWQYDIQFSADSFAKADTTIIFGAKIGSLNPIIGGAFQILILAYALIGKAMQGEAKPMAAMSDEEFEQQKKALNQRQQLNDLRKNPNETGLFQAAKKRLLGNEKDAELLYNSRLNAATDYLRNATDLLDVKQEKKAIELLAVFLKISKKEAVVFLEAVRPILSKENEQLSQKKTERITGPLLRESEEENEENPVENLEGKSEKSSQETNENMAIDPDFIPLVSRYPNCVTLLSSRDTTVWVSDVANAFETSPVRVRNRVNAGKIRKTKNPEKVYKDSVILWAKEEMLSRRNRPIINLESARKSQEKSEEEIAE